MNKDRIEGTVKDVAGRVERQAGEWTDNAKMQVKGAAKQAEGKVQNAVGQMKDAAKDAMKKDQQIEEEDERAQANRRPDRR